MRLSARNTTSLVAVTTGLMFLFAGCGSKSVGVANERSRQGTIEDTTGEISTESGQETATSTGDSGPCNSAAEQIESPVVVSGDATTMATLGVASLECGELNADGWASLGGDPELFDATETVEITAARGPTVVVAWDAPVDFTQTGSGKWIAENVPDGCYRLTMHAESNSKRSSAEYGLDVRVGGATVPCPQQNTS